jgi:hypothetical protein
MKDVQDFQTALGFSFNPHTLRRTAESHMTGMGVQRFTVSKLLNHVDTGVMAIYDRYSCDPEKRSAVGAWELTLRGSLPRYIERRNPCRRHKGPPTSPQVPDPFFALGWISCGGFLQPKSLGGLVKKLASCGWSSRSTYDDELDPSVVTRPARPRAAWISMTRSASLGQDGCTAMARRYPGDSAGLRSGGVTMH